MPRYTTILTVFGKTDQELETICDNIRPTATELQRIDNVFYVQVAAKTKFTKIAAELDDQQLKYAYYFVKQNDQADLYTSGLDPGVRDKLETIALP